MSALPTLIDPSYKGGMPLVPAELQARHDMLRFSSTEDLYQSMFDLYMDTRMYHELWKRSESSIDIMS